MEEDCAGSRLRRVGNSVAKVSIIIPSRNERFLPQTVADIFKKATSSIECIVVCDGYWPDPQLPDYPNLVLIHRSEPRGMRNAINSAAAIAKGKYLLKIFDSTNNYKDLAFQNNLLEYLYKRRVRVPEIIKNKEGKTLTAFNGKYLSVYQFIEGKHLKTLTTELAKSLAKEIAKMHRVLLQYKPAGMGRRLNYNSTQI